MTSHFIALVKSYQMITTVIWGNTKVVTYVVIIMLFTMFLMLDVHDTEGATVTGMILLAITSC